MAVQLRSVITVDRFGGADRQDTSSPLIRLRGMKFSLEDRMPSHQRTMKRATFLPCLAIHPEDQVCVCVCVCVGGFIIFVCLADFGGHLRKYEDRVLSHLYLGRRGMPK